MTTIDKDSEKEFGEWLDSIEFIDKSGSVVEAELTEDTTPDPEGDRS